MLKLYFDQFTGLQIKTFMALYSSDILVAFTVLKLPLFGNLELRNIYNVIWVILAETEFHCSECPIFGHIIWFTFS